VALVASDRHRLEPSGDAQASRGFDVSGTVPLAPLAFDHAELIRLALEHLRRRLAETPVCFELLPAEFTLSELQTLCEAILGRPLDRRNFRRKVQELGFVSPARGARREGRHRPAQVYRFVPQAFARHAGRARTLPF
jgi:8-oxo-dGTP diphosphatase